MPATCPAQPAVPAEMIALVRAHQEVVVAVDRAPLLVREHHELEGVAGLVARHLQRLGDDELTDDPGGVVDGAGEVGVVVGAEENRLGVPVGAGPGADDVVADPALLGALQDDVVPHGDLEATLGELLLEPVPGDPVDVDTRDRPARLAVVRAVGLGDLVVGKVDGEVVKTTALAPRYWASWNGQFSHQ